MKIWSVTVYVKPDDATPWTTYKGPAATADAAIKAAIKTYAAEGYKGKPFVGKVELVCECNWK